MTKRIGFFGGCFNPITNAHLNLIKKAIEDENLDKVYFVPMGDYYSKKDLIKLNHRINMLEIAFEDEEKMEVLNISNLDKKTCAIDTFKLIDKNFSNSERFFIMGSDNYKQIDKWKNAEELTTNYKYIVLNRENESTKSISSSMVREKIKQNESVKDLIPDSVINYIEQKKLYK